MKNLKSQKKFQIIKEHRGLELAIKEKCYDCQCQQKQLDCQQTGCTLFPFRPWANKQSRKNKQISEAEK